MPGLAAGMERLAWVEMADDPAMAARLIGAADAIRETVRTPVSATSREEYERSLRQLADLLGQASFDAGRLEGRGLGIRGVLERAGETEAATPRP